MNTCRYRVEHETRYVYATPALTSQHMAHLTPRSLPRQRVESSEIEVRPTPAYATERVDYYGNTVNAFTILAGYSELQVLSRNVVDVFAPSSGVDPESTAPWEHVRDELVYRRGAAYDSAAEFSYPSPLVPLSSELGDFARAAFPAGRPVLVGALELMHRIHEEFEFDADATSIATPVAKVLAERRGVCQDFAHLGIACLRSLGLAARYVSGYILTDPPPGQPRLVGADASHAWLSIRCARDVWIDLDPTNDVCPDLRHITVAWGRDYGDVSPLRGIVLGGSEHVLHVGVSVTPDVIS